MNILIITQMYPQPDDCGANKVTRTVEYFAKEWVENGHSVIVVHCSSKFPLPLYLIPNKLKDRYAYKTSNIIPSLSSRKKIHREEFGIDIYRVPMLKMLPGRSFSKSKILRVQSFIDSILAKKAYIPDVIIGHFANPSLELVALLGQKYKCKTSIVFHGDCNPSTIEKYRIKENIKLIGAIGARSICEAEQIRHLLSLPNMPFICYSGVPNKAVDLASSGCDKHDYSNGIKYLSVGSLIARKHLDSVIKAFSKVKGQKDVLTIVGGGPEEGALKQLVEDLGIKKQVMFTGRIDRDEVLEQMKKAHIFTLVSDHEVFGMVYFEAMLQGCLTIASKNGGFDGIIVDGKNGFICEPGNDSDLCEVYKRISNLSVSERNVIGKNAIELAKHFSEKDVAAKYLKDVLERNDEI